MPFKDQEAYNEYMRRYRRFERERRRLLSEVVLKQKRLFRRYERQAAEANYNPEKLRIWEEEFKPRFEKILEWQEAKELELRLKYEIGEPKRKIRIRVK